MKKFILKTLIILLNFRCIIASDELLCDSHKLSPPVQNIPPSRFQIGRILNKYIIFDILQYAYSQEDILNFLWASNQKSRNFLIRNYALSYTDSDLDKLMEESTKYELKRKDIWVLHQRGRLGKTLISCDHPDLLDYLNQFPEVQIKISLVNVFENFQQMKRPNIKGLLLYELKKIKNINSVIMNCPNIEILGLENLKSFKNFEYLKNFQKLKILELVGLPHVKNLNFLKNIPNLERLSLLSLRNLKNLDLLKSLEKLNFFQFLFLDHMDEPYLQEIADYLKMHNCEIDRGRVGPPIFPNEIMNTDDLSML